MRRVLIVSPHFPPTNAPDMHRARHALRHLSAHGWHADVLAVDPRDVAAPSDPLLREDPRPDDAIVEAVRAPLAPWSRWLRLSSVGRRATRVLGPAGDRLLTGRRYDLVFFTTSQHRVLTLGPEWRRRHGVPYAADWQDPWVTDYYDRPGAPAPPGGWKYYVAARSARKLEGPVLAGAGGVVSVNAAYLRQLETRYPWFGPKPRAVIPFGADPADYERARREDVRPAFQRRAGVRHLLYVGAVGEIMRPAIECLLQGLRQWLDAGGEGGSVRLHFVGTSYAPQGAQEGSVAPLAAKAGLAEMVEEHPARIGQFQALRTLLEADGCLILGSDNTAYSPSKIATVALARRPVLGVVAGGSELEAGLRHLGLGTLARFSPAGDPATVVQFLRTFVSPLPAPDRLATLTAESRTRELAEFFNQVVAVR